MDLEQAESTDRARPAPTRRQVLFGYTLAIGAVTMWSINASVSRELLEDGLSAMELAQLRAGGAFIVLAVLLAVFRFGLLRTPPRELPRLAFLGIFGVGLLYLSYSQAIERIPIGVALTLEYLAPVLIVLWLAVRYRRRLPRPLIVATGLAVVGCFFVVGANPSNLDALGVLAGFGAAVGYASYLIGAEQAAQRHLHPATTLVWAFGAATLVLLAASPPYDIPDQLSTGEGAALAAETVVLATLVPFAMMLAAVRYVPAVRIAVVGALEPALSALFAFLIHDEGLSGMQVGGGLLLLATVMWVQAQRPDFDVEFTNRGNGEWDGP